jgi:hypothetical protein
MKAVAGFNRISSGSSSEPKTKVNNSFTIMDVQKYGFWSFYFK